MSCLLFTENHIQQHYDFLDTCGFLGAGKGYLRPAFSDLETQAMEHFRQWATARGAVDEWDPVRNLTLTFNHTADDFVEFISHVDTVPNGGNADGVAGVIAAVLAAEYLVKSGRLPKNIGAKVKIPRGEESGTFGVAYLGSLAAYGMLDPVHLNKNFGGQSLRDAMISQGVDLSYIEKQKPTISAGMLDRIISSQELHIEQGPILLNSQCDIGVVTSIRGAIRLNVELLGEWAHSGTTPIAFRKDANLGMARAALEVQSFLERQLRLLPPQTNPECDLVCTVAELHGGSGFSSVSGASQMKIDMRGISSEYLNECVEALTSRLDRLAQGYGLKCKVSEASRTNPVACLDSSLQRAELEAASAFSLSAQRMPSGAGHDSAVIAGQVRSDGRPMTVGMIFIPNEGLSHSPTEYTSLQAIARGASVLAESAARYVKSLT